MINNLHFTPTIRTLARSTAVPISQLSTRFSPVFCKKFWCCTYLESFFIIWIYTQNYTILWLLYLWFWCKLLLYFVYSKWEYRQLYSPSVYELYRAKMFSNYITLKKSATIYITQLKKFFNDFERVGEKFWRKHH